MKEKPDNWNELTPEEKRTMRLDAWVSAEGIKFDSPEAEAKYKELVTLFRDAIELKKAPARVPCSVLAGGYILKWAGIPFKATMYDRWQDVAQAVIDFHKEYDPDTSQIIFMMSGKSMELLGVTNLRWPGYNLPDESTYQAVENEYMTVGEYDHFINDPSDFVLRYYLPRLNRNLKGLCKLPQFSIQAIMFGGITMPFMDPELQEALDILKRAAEMLQKPGMINFDMMTRINGMGYPNLAQLGTAGAAGTPPYDILGDSLRGAVGIMIDLHRNPDKIIEACEKILSLIPEPDVPLGDSPLVMLPLHKGDDYHMSNEQFERFYWPTFKKSLFKLINEGLIPVPFAEGGYNRRLEYIAELPRASTVWYFDRTDMHRAKDVLGDKCCIMGNVPISLVATGDPDNITSYCKDLIDYCGRDGGFILSPGCQVDNSRDENIRAIINVAKEYLPS
ncbi:MAG: hypothetical protein JW882_05680 [Deltaproteobacteria bacterium]|nr:hypothetical protein [Deltaproteobacteria bacterium]